MTELSETQAVRRLVDRFGFGAGGADLAASQARGYEATLETLLSPSGPDAGVAATPIPTLEVPTRNRAASGGQQGGAKGTDKDATPEVRAARQEYRRALKAQQLTATRWWLDRMVRAEQPVRERLTWLWHGHFATSAQKVRVAGLMLRQNETFRTAALGSFTDLARSLIVDPALLVWLDGNDNTAQAPNENLAREFMELFVLGHGAFSEDDVKEAARALTGWKVDAKTGGARLRPKLHDRQSKTVLGQTGDFDAEGLVGVLLSQPTSAPFVIGRLWFRLVGERPPSSVTREKLLAAYGGNRDIRAVLRTIGSSPEMRDSESSMVKQPVEWVVGTARALGVVPSTTSDRAGSTTDKKQQAQGRLLVALRGMGQIPFRPPSVGGWPSGGAWLTTAAAAGRLAAARALAAQADLHDIARTSTRNRTEAIRHTLGVDAFSARTADAISQVSDRPADAVALAAVSPEYVVSR